MKITDYLKTNCPFCFTEVIIETSWNSCFYVVCQCNKCGAHGTAWGDHFNIEWKSTRTSEYTNLNLGEIRGARKDPESTNI